MTLQIGRGSRRVALVLALVAASSQAAAQVFQNAVSKVPQGGPFNNSNTEAVDFADVDFDGDFDCAVADGGDCCNDQNRLWINLGGAQGGSIGFFADQTSTRFPVLFDNSMDMDFADLDNDGDQDLYTSNSSEISAQPCRFWINMGGAQGGSAGFFQDQTAARWVNLGVNNGTTTFSSIPRSMVLGNGGFVEWSHDGVFGDLDRDGDLDLVHTTAGNVFQGAMPTRTFLNDGSGYFEEFNPSGFQLTSSTLGNGWPALWCEGLQMHGTTNTTGQEADIADVTLGAELGDLDADLDLDLVNGDRLEYPRVFTNRQVELAGELGFRDVTWAALAQPASGGLSYEQELGDLDLDGDLDLFGINWIDLVDVVAFNMGAGNFGLLQPLADSVSDDNEGEIFDFDADGDLDLFVANFSGQERLYRNNGAPGWTFTNVTASTLPVDTTISLQADACDVDGDGDYDVMVANDAAQPNVLLENLGLANDASAPRLPSLEQAPHRAPSATPTRVTAHVLDNAPWTVTQFNAGALDYRVDAGALQSAPLDYAGGNLFRGELPGTLAGVVRYRARSQDAYGNSGVSPWRAFSASTSPPQAFCTSKATSIPGCVPALVGSSSQVSKNSGPGSYGVAAAPVPGTPGSMGILIYTRSGLLGAPVNTSFGVLCLSQFARLGSFLSTPGGTAGACDGSYYWDFGAVAQATAAIQPGDTLHVQAWYRDPPNAGAANLTHGIGPIAVVP
jgi:hypothetical protein